MHELRVQAWDEKRKTMFTPYYSYLPKGVTRKKDFFIGFNSTGLEVSEYEGKGYWRRFPIRLYTGLKDRNGKEIYEGDIIQITYDTNYSEKPYYIGFIEYGAEKGYPAFDLIPWIDCEMNAPAWLKSETDNSVLNYEVIGNVWENGEMLNDCKRSETN